MALFTGEPRQRGAGRLGLERRPLGVPVLGGGSGSPGAGPPHQVGFAGLRQLLDELLFNVL